jgi:hypothetical protein
VLYKATKEGEFGGGTNSLGEKWYYEYECRSCHHSYYSENSVKDSLADPEDVKKERERHEIEVSLHEIKEKQYKDFCAKYGEFLVRFLKEHVEVTAWGDTSVSIQINN